MKKNLLIAKGINLFIIVIPFILVWDIYYSKKTLLPGSNRILFLILIMILISYSYFSNKFHIYRFDIQQDADILFNQFVIPFIIDIFAYLILIIFSNKVPNLIPGIITFSIQAMIGTLFALILRKSYSEFNSNKKAIIIYDNNSLNEVKRIIDKYNVKDHYSVQSYLNIEDFNKNIDCIKNYDSVFLFGTNDNIRNTIIKNTAKERIRLYFLPKVSDLIIKGSEGIELFHLPFLESKMYDTTIEYTLTKRFFDILLSLIAIVILSPVFILAAIMVKLDGGPVLYKQTRLTQNGRKFNIYKFRSMKVDAEKYSGAVLSSGENDPRITKVGKIIRACRIDELPQLFNIIIGDMSIVGPRPERPELQDQIEKLTPDFKLRLKAKAGLTGYAQVYGKYNTTFYDKLLMDLIYISQPSLLNDLTIIFATFKILFSKESTEGVENKLFNKVDNNRGISNLQN